MSIETHTESRLFVPGAKFVVSNASELHDLETTIAHEVDPIMSFDEEQEWNYQYDSQPSLREFRYGKELFVAKELGVLVMDRAYETVINAEQNGWQLEARRRPRKHDATGRLGERTVGIVLSTEHEGVSFERAAWYVPQLANFHANRGRYQTQRQHTPVTVRRYVSHPRVASGE